MTGLDIRVHVKCSLSAPTQQQTAVHSRLGNISRASLEGGSFRVNTGHLSPRQMAAFVNLPSKGVTVLGGMQIFTRQEKSRNNLWRCLCSGKSHFPPSTVPEAGDEGEKNVVSFIFSGGLTANFLAWRRGGFSLQPHSCRHNPQCVCLTHISSKSYNLRREQVHNFGSQVALSELTLFQSSNIFKIGCQEITEKGGISCYF